MRIINKKNPVSDTSELGQGFKVKHKSFLYPREVFYAFKRKMIDFLGYKIPVTTLYERQISTNESSRCQNTYHGDKLIALNKVPGGIREYELEHKNRFIFDPSKDLKLELVIDVQKSLDKNIRYLWLLKLDENNHPQIRVGYEYTEDSMRYGHPTLAKISTGDNYSGLIGGELYFDKKSNGWNINNDSGRYGYPDKADLISQAIKVQDLLDIAANRFSETGLTIKNTINYTLPIRKVLLHKAKRLLNSF